MKNFIVLLLLAVSTVNSWTDSLYISATGAGNRTQGRIPSEAVKPDTAMVMTPMTGGAIVMFFGGGTITFTDSLKFSLWKGTRLNPNFFVGIKEGVTHTPGSLTVSDLCLISDTTTFPFINGTTKRIVFPDSSTVIGIKFESDTVTSVLGGAHTKFISCIFNNNNSSSSARYTLGLGVGGSAILNIIKSQNCGGITSAQSARIMYNFINTPHATNGTGLLSIFNNVIIGNVFYKCGTNGINISNSYDLTIERNTFYRNYNCISGTQSYNDLIMNNFAWKTINKFLVMTTQTNSNYLHSNVIDSTHKYEKVDTLGLYRDLFSRLHYNNEDTVRVDSTTLVAKDTLSAIARRAYGKPFVFPY